MTSAAVTTQVLQTSPAEQPPATMPQASSPEQRVAAAATPTVNRDAFFKGLKWGLSVAAAITVGTPIVAGILAFSAGAGPWTFPIALASLPKGAVTGVIVGAITGAVAYFKTR